MNVLSQQLKLLSWPVQQSISLLLQNMENNCNNYTSITQIKYYFRYSLGKSVDKTEMQCNYHWSNEEGIHIPLLNKLLQNASDQIINKYKNIPMISFQDRFKGKMSYRQFFTVLKIMKNYLYISKYGINQSPDIKQNSQILQQDQSNNKSLQKIINLNSKSPIKNSYFYKLPPIKNKIVDRTLNFNQQKQQIQTKKIYSADHSKISLKKYDSDLELIQMKHLQYLNKIEQLYMLQKN